MEIKCISLLATLLFLAISIDLAVTSYLGDNIQAKLTQFANDGLGVADFQYYLDTQVQFQSQPLDGSVLVKEVAETMSTKLQIRIQALHEMARQISNAYEDIETTNPFQDCCKIPVYEESKILKTRVNMDELCTTGQGLRLDPKQFLPKSINNIVKEQYNKALGIKYAYYGSEEGVMFNYPSLRICDKEYDPRFRPWYVEAATPQSKDLVIVIDTSGSMSTKDNSGDTLINIANKAATTVLDTLNPNDRIGIVTFSDEASTPPGRATTSTCYSNHLAVASAQNKEYLKYYISHIVADGRTYYGKALDKAFQYFKNTPPPDRENIEDRAQVIVFLTDGIPTDGLQHILNLIDERNAELNNSVVILTYGLGPSVNSAVLTDIAEQKQNGEAQKGIYTYVEDPKNLRLAMGSYYAQFKQEGYPEVLFTVPFVDAFGSGLTEAMCLPVSYQNNLKGVACMELSVDDMLSEITYFKEAEQSYAFIVDKTARVLTHPLISQPDQVTNNPYFIYLRSLEPIENIEDIIVNMTSGGYGSLTTSANRIISRGNVKFEGVDASSVEATYSWYPIVGTGFSICLVIPVNDVKSQIVWTNEYPGYLYHRLDLSTQSLHKCKQFNRIAVADRPMLFFAARAFEDPFNYIYTEETSIDIDRYEVYLTGKSNQNPGFKEGVRETVAVTSIFEDIISERRSYDRYSVWRYVGMENGVHRTFPASETPKNYDPTKRTWYLRAKAHTGQIAVSTPYEDAFGAGTVITLSQEIFEGKSTAHTPDDTTIGVMGMDFTLQYFYYLVTDVEQCEKYKCFIVDDSGFIIVHKDWVQSKRGSYNVEDIHITSYETGIANHLVTKKVMKYDRCTNIENLHDQYFWRLALIHGSSMVVPNSFELHEIPNTNVFLVIVTKGSSANCHCYATHDLVPCLPFSSHPCFCPCYKDADVYKYCEGQFAFSSDTQRQCTPPVPSVNFHDVTEKEKYAVKSLAECSSYNCSDLSKDTPRKCNSVVSCSWCEYDGYNNRLTKPYCHKQTTCPNGYYPKGTDPQSVHPTQSPEDREKGGKTSDFQKYGKYILIAAVILVVIVAIAVSVKFYSSKKNKPASAPSREHVHGFDNLAMADRPLPYAPPPPYEVPMHGGHKYN